MPREPQNFEATANDFPSGDYCGATYAARLLGLSVASVQSLVEKGEIEAWQTLGGHGRLSLRAIHAYLQKTSGQLAPTDPDPRSRLSVLVVEDEEDARELYKAQFDEWDLAVDCSYMASALEALIDITTMRPDLLITDLNMPGVDGMELLRALKRNPQLLDMQILVISGLPKAAVAARGGLPPNSLYLEKPINFDWLHGYMAELLVANRKGR
jgi:excisionase family DNA binding protein